MDKRLYVAWNNYTRHQLGCPKRCQWLDVFLYLALKQKEFRFTQFFRGMSSILIEQLLYDMSGMNVASSVRLDNADNNDMLVTYCLRRRGWLLLHALASSNLRSLTGVTDLVDLLIHLSQMEMMEEDEQNPSVVVDGKSFWPMADLGTIVTRADLRNVKKPRTNKSSKRPGHRWTGTTTTNRFSNPVTKDDLDGHYQLTPSSSVTDLVQCCQQDDPEQQSNILIDQWNQVQLPALQSDTFDQLILSLLEQLVGHHGDVRYKSGGSYLDQRVMQFALQRLVQPSSQSEEQRRLFRLVLRSMVSIVQHRRLLQIDLVIPPLLDAALASSDCCPTDFADEVIEGLLRFLVVIHPMDDENLFHQWLNHFHSRICLDLITDALESDRPVLSAWIPLIGTVLSNVSSGRNHRKSIYNQYHHHHHAYGKALTDPDQLDNQSCSIASLFYILLRIYQLGTVSVQQLVLEALAGQGGQPCCCLPADIIYQILFQRVVPSPEFLAVLETVFRRIGFAAEQPPTSIISSDVQPCPFCRYNGGVELERCRQMGVYASTESLMNKTSSCWNVSLPPDPWRSFDLYAEYVLERTDQPFSLSIIKHVGHLIVTATNQVKSEIFARLFYPILTLPPSGTANPSDRSSILGQMTEACWHMTAILVRQKDICELFLSSNGLELLLDLCRSPDWSWNVARVLESMIDIQCHDGQPDTNPPAQEATALAILEHLLVHHLWYVLRSLMTGTSTNDWGDRVLSAELKAATMVADGNPAGSLDAVWVHQLDGFQHLAGNLRTASALWATTVRLVVRNWNFSLRFKKHSLVGWIRRIIPALCLHLTNPVADNWNLYADLLELFLTLSLLTGTDPVVCSKLVLEHFNPGRHLVAIYDMLLRCSTLERWIHREEVDRVPVSPVFARPEPLAFEKKSSPTPNGSSGSGYEADEDAAPFSSQEPNVPVARNDCHLFYPVVVHELIVHFSHWLSAQQNAECSTTFQDFVPCWTRMVSICSNRLTASVLANQGVLTTLLSRTMRPMFQQIGTDGDGIRRQMLSMMKSLGEQRITAGELQLLIDVLKGENEEEEKTPWADVLSVFRHLIETGGYRPTHTLDFPIRRIKMPEEDDDSIHLSSGSIGSFVQVNDIRSEIFTMTKQAMELGKLHETRGIGSAWKCAAVFLPILTDNNWNMQTDGLTMSTWLFLSASPSSHHRRPSSVMNHSVSYGCPADEWIDYGGDVHLFSMGTKSFLVEWWLDPSAHHRFLVRLSQSTHSHSQALATQTLDLKMPTERWTHLAVGCRQRASVNGFHRVVNIQVFLNGHQSATMDLKVPLAPVKRIGNSHSFLLLGTTTTIQQPAAGKEDGRIAPPTPSPCWSFGNAALFKGQILTAEMAALLCAMGPDSGVLLASCQDGKTRPNWPRFLRPACIKPSLDWDRVVDSHDNPLMGTLQSNLLMTYSAHKPETVFIYPCIISPTAGIFGSILPSGCVFNAISSDPRSSQQPPIALSVAVAAPVQSRCHASFHAALKQLGGYPILLFLLGQTIEKGAADGHQALALEVLFQWLRSDAQEAHLFDVQRGYPSLQYVFHAEGCRPGQHMAAVLINLSCSTPIVMTAGGNGDAIVVDPHLLSFAIQCWKHWQRYSDVRRHHGRTTMDLLLDSLQHLLRDNHPYRDFNVKQMERAGILPLLLHLARECSVYQECVALTEKQAAMMADLVEGLIGSPPTVSALTSVVDYLLLLHPAEQTYCPSNASGYPYFFSVVSSHAIGSKIDGSSNNSADNYFQSRDWKLPEGYETFAPQSNALLQPMNANRLGTALREVIVKWSDADLKESDNQSPSPPSAFQSSSPPEASGMVNAKSVSTLSINVRDEADITLSLHLFRVLIASMRVLPDSMVKQVIGQVIRPDVLVVMARHQRDRMRAGAIRLLATVLARSQEEEQLFIKQNGIVLLAHQLQPYAATGPVVEACVSLCVGVDVILEQVLDPFAIWPENPTQLQLQSTVLLLSLLPNSALDPALFHQLATLIRTLATRSNQILKFLLDFGLVETLGKSVVALAHAAQTCPGDILEQREDEILLEAVHRILILVAARTVAASGNVPWTVFQEMILLFHFMERVESGRCGCQARCVRMLHESCCVILKQAIQTIQHRLEFNQIQGRNHHHHAQHQHLFAFQPGTSHFQQVTDKILQSVLPVSINRKMKLDKFIGPSEILERFRFLLAKAVDHISVNVELNPSGIETAFSQDLLATLVRGVSSILERPKSNGFRYHSTSADGTWLTDWSHYYPPDSSDLMRTLYWNSRQAMTSQLNRLVVFLSSPLQDAATLHFVVKTLHDDPHHEDLFKLMTPAAVGDDPADFMDTLDAHLCHFLHSRKLAENVEHSTLIRIHCISRCLRPSTHRRRCQVLDLIRLKERLQSDRQSWWRMQEEAQIRLLSRYDQLIRQTCDVAAKWTALSVESQNSVRHLFLKRLRRDHGSTILAANHWIQLVRQWTHQRAAWHFPSGYLRGWRMDATEGYQRMHLRLERCALNVDAKYLLPRGSALLEPEEMARPLTSIVRMSNLQSIDDVIGHGEEKILRTVNCWLVTTTAETSGELILTDSWMTFLPAECGADEEEMRKFSSITYDDVREILTRRFQLQDRALELFLKDGRTRLLVMNSVEERNGVQRELMELCGKLIPTENLAEVTQLWRDSQITNFEYLVFLNKMAGRSFNDLMQYPIFPFVLADYESAVLELDDPHVYRNFKKPMAVQNESRDQHYIENYNYLKRDFENRPEGSGPNFGPFHYGSLYSNPGIVLHFLVRLPPFTKLLMEYQDRNFDVPDRSFHSVGTSWRLASSDSTTDVKELIPEFFYLPEFLVNSLGFDFGMQQSGDPVDDVQLPPWSLGKPRLFVQIHRQALESSWVRDHLHHWIDLIFGFKQSGQAAIDSINVFHPSTYSGFDATTRTDNDDPIERNAKLTMIRSYGQVPRQLFRQPHPMSVQPLNAKTIRRSRGLLPSVHHLQWGCYVGSPSCHDPVLKHKESFAIPVHSFLPLRTGDTYVMGPFTAAILAHSYDKDSFLGRPTGILGVALISWGQSDGIVRIKIRKDEPVKPLFRSEVHDAVVLCATAPDYQQIWVGYRSGMMRAYPFSFDPLRPHFELTGPAAVLCGHVGPVQQLILCPSFGVAVSAGSDGSVIVWDLHRLTFVRQWTPGLSSDQKDVILPVVQLAVNRDTADIALAVHVDERQSRLELRSVNGQLVAMTTSHPLITSLCFSSAPEGISINVVAAGLSNGRIRLWDTWTLNVVRDIMTDSLLSIVSLAYSSTSQHLLAARSDGFLLVWDSPHNHKKSTRYPPFINLTLQ